ncbi:MAG: carbonic anhydrase [Planctomycetes bacterium]|nr:carbonic anhydrase [Planctomycetota bacterium]
MRTLLCLCTGLFVCVPVLRSAVGGPDLERAREARADPLERLASGNQRYRSGKADHFNEDRERRRDLAHAQHPFALVIGCADSRVPPELVFDQGLGELFVVRSAGEVLDDLSIASVEYAVEHLDVRTIIVLGHERCGAVTAALSGGELPGHLKYLARAIEPHIEEARAQLPKPADGAAPGSAEIPPEVLDAAVEQNVRGVIADLENCGPILSELAHTGELRFVGARYDLDTGAVEWLGQPKAQEPASRRPR